MATSPSDHGPRPGRLLIVCGLPGAGKTTRARALEARLGATRFDPDDWLERLNLDLWDQARRTRIEHLQWELAKALIAAGGTAIIEWGTWGRSERDRLRKEARALGATVELILVDAPVEMLYARIAARNREIPPITREHLAEWAAAFQAPTAEELALFDPPEDEP